MRRAKVCAVDHWGRTPLHYAAAMEDIGAMELLLAHGADLNARTRIDDCATPLEEMEILGREKAAAFLRKAAETKRKSGMDSR